MDAKSTPTRPLSEPAHGLLDLARLGHVFLRRWWLAVLCAALGGAGAAYYLSRTPRIYAATAVLQLAQQGREIVKFQDAAESEDYRSPEVVKTFEQVLTGGTLLLRVVQANHLAADPAFAPPKANGAPYLDSELIERMAAKVFVNVRRGTRLLDVSVEDRDPVKACALTSSLIEQFRQFEIAQKAKLEESEKTLAQYRADHQAVSLEDKQNIVVAKLKELNDRVIAAKGARLALEADVARIGARGDAQPEALLELTSINSVPAVADLVRQINAKEAEFAAIKQRYLWKHVRYIEAQTTLAKLHAALGAEINNAAASINRAYQGAQENEAKLEAALDDQEKAALTLDSVAIPYKAMLRQTESDRALYENVLARMKEAGLNTGIHSDDDLRVVQAPTVPYRPSKPSRLKTLAIGVVIGAFAGGVAILLLEILHFTLQTVDQAEHLLGLPLLAGVPELRRRAQKAGGAPPALVSRHDAPPRAAFRTLRTTLTMFKGRETRSFLFTSAVPGEGKSFCSLNFAATLARQGCHTLLIAADLRREDQYPALLKARDQPGLYECLTGGLPLAQAVHATNLPNLFLCPVGTAGGDPAGLLSGDRFAALLRESLGVFDRVVIDSPPINAVADALLIAPHADAVCLVVRACRTPVKAALRACRTLARSGVMPAGFVFNRLALRLGYRSAYYYYGRDHQTSDTPAGAPVQRG